MGNWIKPIVYGVGGILGTCAALLVTFQEKLVYVPVLPGTTKGYSITPASLHLNYEDVWLTSADGVRLHAWFLRRLPHCAGPNSKLKLDGSQLRMPKTSPAVAGTDDLDQPLTADPTILYFQENAGNIGDSLGFTRSMLENLKCNVFMLSYRGYGASDGYPSQAGIIRDSQAALEHLLQRTDIDRSKIVVFGRSLGGAVGVALAKNNPEKFSALILENTFTSVLDMAGVVLPPLKRFIGSNDPRILNFLVRSPWNTIDIIDQIKQPILFISGSRDELVPPAHMRMLYEKTKHNRRCMFEEFPKGTHMNTWYMAGERYWQVMQHFLEKELSSSESK
ncbi:alpha/beta hydrolase domain-containing protein WAV2 isoform X1 [Cryptomeria japonica]|uniref:alpha/beta hydrolase domain-containing protein WAV2 isoform X1 n=1 Tax=Cryptomeria japonica TaxID=3369 RepID=UPI0027DA0687|nr:alpha/beta hydrolase domain-containing protein WAV2 isoform X1 [Cryptomeria japonica]XP_057822075.2 alpha/beta hydrolase domain-containing protein WAV2 isoform X1 [Cryptomeria japonica]